MSELFDKQVNAQKEKNFRGSHKLPQAHKKCAMEIKQEKRRMPKINLMEGRKEFIRCVQKARVMDVQRLQVNNS